MNKEELMSMFEKDYYPSSDCIKHYRIKEFEDIIEKIVIKHKLLISELEAKVYTYENIIANSNFAPILKENKKEDEIDRLNNIINYIWQVFENGGFEDGCDCIKIYDYLKELKENNKDAC